MLKSKRSIIIFGIIIVILLIVSLILILKKERNDRVLEMYEKICNNQDFTFSMEEEIEELKYKVSMAQRGADVSIDMYTDEEHTTTLVVDGQAYFVIHNLEEYLIYDSDDIDADIIISGLKEITKKEYEAGREKINQKTYYYEEYENDTGDFLIFANVNENSIIKTRFYFDGNDIAFIKNIVTTEGELEEELIKVTLQYSVDEKVFEIPQSYAELES